jgi:tRNA nucleotidyltransferase (CCA-adding enzyme)
MKKNMPLPAYVKSTIRALNDAGYEAYVVGGAVRSWLLGTEAHDHDITTNATPAEVKAVFKDKKTVDTGIRHGTVTVVDRKIPIEITTYRTETGYTDHRHPDQVLYTRSLEEDCARRDFTINALCYHPKEGIRDFFGGVQDLQNFVIRCVGDPAKRFDEDALRILRAVRFAAQLGFAIEDATRKALEEGMPTLHYVSQERITSELIKTVGAPYFKSVLKEYRPLFILLIPELQELSAGRWEGILMDISRSPSDPAVRMALLLDGLNDTARSDEILRRLKYSNNDRYAVTNLLENKNLPLGTRIDMRKALNHLTVPVSQYFDFRCARDTRLCRGDLDARYQQILADKDCYSFKQLEVTGKDFKALNLKGPQISAAMNACLLAVMEERIPNTRDAILQYLKQMYS